MENASPLHPIQAPFATHALNVGDGHTLYVEESGNPHGLPALYLHGGPGSGTEPSHRGYFDPAIYHIVIFDQRGCGQSTAEDPLHANTTQHLLADIETIRTRLGINSWHTVAGWSWGSTLALAYAQTHPQQVRSLVLSSTFLADAEALDWMLGPDGAAKHYPSAYQALFLHLLSPLSVPKVLLSALKNPDETQAFYTAKLFIMYDALTMDPAADPLAIQSWIAENPAEILGNARLMAHYLAHDCFLAPHQILKNLSFLAEKKVFISHGTADMCCLPASSEALKAALPLSIYDPVPHAGHRSTDALKSQRVAHLQAAARLSF